MYAWVRREMYTELWWEDLKGRNHSEDMCRWGCNIGMYFRETGWDGVDWMNLAQDRDHWWALVSKVLNL
jgi:hypothetical protein